MRSDFYRVVAMHTLSGIGMMLVGMFIPIYLLELGFSLTTVIAWLLVHHVSLPGEHSLLCSFQMQSGLCGVGTSVLYSYFWFNNIDALAFQPTEKSQG